MYWQRFEARKETRLPIDGKRSHLPFNAWKRCGRGCSKPISTNWMGTSRLSFGADCSVAGSRRDAPGRPPGYPASAVGASAAVGNAERALELANKAHSLYEMQNCDEQGKLLQIVLSNCTTDGVTLWPVYRKPFDVIFNRAKTEEWCAREDSNF